MRYYSREVRGTFQFLRYPTSSSEGDNNFISVNHWSQGGHVTQRELQMMTKLNFEELL